MNALAFQFDDAVPVRVIEDEGLQWFVGPDVARALGYSSGSRAIRQHAKGRAKRLPLQTAGGIQQVRVINEADVMRLIVGSQLPSAQRFEAWIFETLLPTIRRNGGYGGMRDLHPIPETMPAALRLAADTMEQNRALEARVDVLRPQVAALHRIGSAGGSVSLTCAAKELKMPPKALITWMLEIDWLYRRGHGTTLLAKQTRIDGKWLEHRVVTFIGSDGTDRASTQVMVLPKGIARLALLLEQRDGTARAAEK